MSYQTPLRVILSCNELLANPPLRIAPFCVGLLSYFEATRRLKKRSLLEVNEHFSGKVDAKIANKATQTNRFVVRRQQVLSLGKNPDDGLY